jgi:uncharacterized protein YbaP (TraB family)
MLKRIAIALLALLSPAFADDASVVYEKIPAHPAMWTVHGPNGTVYLFGSFHALPPDVDWHTKEIDAAMAKADVMVFEIAMDSSFQERVQTYIRDRGMLPPGQHLRDMLPPKEQKEFDDEIGKLPLSAAAVDRMRPWLASIMLGMTASLQKSNLSARSGVEMQIMEADAKDKRPVIGLETIEQQMSFFIPNDPKAELEEFEAVLDQQQEFSRKVELGPLLDAWMHGKTDRLDTLMSREFERYPKARKLLLDDRNARWVTKISEFLGTGKTYFITVGAAHLVGKGGVPNLLRQKGFRVDGP